MTSWILSDYVTRPHPQPHPGQILLTFQPHVGLSLAWQGPTLVVQVKLLLSVPPCFMPLTLGCPWYLPTDIPQVASPRFQTPSHFLPFLPVFSILSLGSCPYAFRGLMPSQAAQAHFSPELLFALKASNVTLYGHLTTSHTQTHKAPLPWVLRPQGPSCFFLYTISLGQCH